MESKKINIRKIEGLKADRQPPVQKLFVEPIEQGGEAILRLNRKVKRINEKLTIKDLFDYLRHLYYEGLSPQNKTYIENVGATILPEVESGVKSALFRIIDENKLDWTDLNFHLRYRMHTFDAFARIFGENHAEGADSFRNRYLLSVLPLNMVLPKEVIMKFVPPADYFSEHLTGTIDPYGIWMKGSLILDENGDYLASRKFKDVILVNITENCPIGCAGCYKSALTREKNGELREKFDLVTEEKRVVSQIEGVVRWLNAHPEVTAIVISGGEPLMYNNAVYGRMLEELKNAENLKIARICTATIFQGLPFRIDDELLGLLRSFSEKTGKRVAFMAHISNHHQLTPEALVAAKKIKKNEFDILLQMPIQKDINFFAKNKDDHEGIRKTAKYFTKISEMANAAGLQNYKWIVDMHPRTQERVVPIELLLEIFGRTFEAHEYSDMTRPNYLELLCRQGNVYLTKDTLANTAKIVNHEIGTVTYFILVGDKVVLHREPLIKEVNDSEATLISHDKLQPHIENYTKYVLPIEKKIKEILSSDLPAKEKKHRSEQAEKRIGRNFRCLLPPINKSRR